MKRYIGQKSRFFIPTCIQRPRYGGPSRSIAIPFGTKKTTMVWLPEGDKKLKICLAISTEYRRATDGRTDRQTSCDGIVRAIHSIAR